MLIVKVGEELLRNCFKRLEFCFETNNTVEKCRWRMRTISKFIDKMRMKRSMMKRMFMRTKISMTMTRTMIFII